MNAKNDLEKIRQDMAPGCISADGFLGSDSRSLSEIISDDAAEMKRFDADPARIARRMTELRDAGARGLGAVVSVPPGLEVRVESDRGCISCPFGHEGVFPKTNITVRNMKTGREVVFSDLNIHMMKEHGFCEGRGSAYRQEPAVLVDVLACQT